MDSWYCFNTIYWEFSNAFFVHPVLFIIEFTLISCIRILSSVWLYERIRFFNSSGKKLNKYLHFILPMQVRRLPLSHYHLHAASANSKRIWLGQTPLVVLIGRRHELHKQVMRSGYGCSCNCEGRRSLSRAASSIASRHQWWAKVNCKINRLIIN